PAAAGACARSGFPKAAPGGLLSTPCAGDRSCPKRPLTWAFLPAYLPGGARLCDCLPEGASRYIPTYGSRIRALREGAALQRRCAEYLRGDALGGVRRREYALPNARQNGPEKPSGRTQ